MQVDVKKTLNTYKNAVDGYAKSTLKQEYNCENGSNLTIQEINAIRKKIKSLFYSNFLGAQKQSETWMKAFRNGKLADGDYNLEVGSNIGRVIIPFLNLLTLMTSKCFCIKNMT